MSSYIESILDNSGIEYRLSNRDIVIRCLNPDHQDSAPSLRIDKATGLFNCLSCGFKGGIHRLHDLLGVEAPPAQLLLEVKQAEARRLIENLSREIVVEIPQDAQRLETSIRNLSVNTITDHEFFFTDDSPYAKIPIHDASGKLRFIEARALDDTKPKYLRLPADVKVDFLYNIGCGAPSIVLVEGIFDYLRLYDLGIRNVCPLFGLYNFNKGTITELRKHGVVKIITMMDNDTAGQRAATMIKRTASLGGIMTDSLIPITDPGDLIKTDLLAILREKGYTIKNKFIV